MHNVVCCVLMDRPDVGTHKVLVNFRVINVGRKYVDFASIFHSFEAGIANAISSFK